MMVQAIGKHLAFLLQPYLQGFPIKKESRTHLLGIQLAKHHALREVFHGLSTTIPSYPCLDLGRTRSSDLCSVMVNMDQYGA